MSEATTELKDKIDDLLQEGLILVTAVEVLVGVQYRGVFESGFAKLAVQSQYLKVLALGLLLAALALVLAPASYHRIVTQGEDTDDVHRVSSRLHGFALLPIAIGLGIEFYIAVEKVLGTPLTFAAGLIAVLFALSAWFGLEFFALHRRANQLHPPEHVSKPQSPKPLQADEGTPLKDKVKQVLEETRMVIPGAQALLGFQFATMLVEGFDKLPDSSKVVHLVSLALIAVSTILLMTPAAYHRIVEQGENTEHFHRFATRIVTLAMAPLALGIAGDVYVVVEKVLKSASSGVLCAALTAAAFCALWFGFTFYRRAQRRAARLSPINRTTE